MMIKKKSIAVAVISSLVISLVLIVNLAGYLIYLELKEAETEKAYQILLHKARAQVYSRHIDLARLGASFEQYGALSGKAVLEGIVRNYGYRDISGLLIKVRFLDPDGASLYEIVFNPMEPSLGSQVSLPHLTSSYISAIKPEGSLPFKKILTDCPKEILSEIRSNASAPKSRRWSGKFDYKILSIDLS
ncbi:MAG: hypothetical protein JXB40_04505 [Candidatus Omnitrophica bacterium]|nr:hypothetical protein [Candidatus Omnitrophota bacterium]